MTGRVLLFVYGTLHPDYQGKPSEFLRARSQRLGPAFTSGRLYDAGPFPVAVFDPESQDRIYGELLELTALPATLDWLDRYEGYNPRRPLTNLFIRSEITVFAHDIPYPCFAYQAAHPPENLPLIASGDYLAYLAGH